MASALQPSAWGLGHCWLEAGPRAGSQDREGPQVSPTDQSATNPEASTPQI